MLIGATRINVFDKSCDNPRIQLFYGDILVPGMVIYHQHEQWTLSQPIDEQVLHSVWTNTNGETKSAYKFLKDLVASKWPVEIIFDPTRYIPTSYQELFNTQDGNNN